MKLLFVGIDRQLFEEGTEAYTRMQAYGRIFDEVHSVVMTKRSMGFETTKLADNVMVHATNSISKFQYVRDAIRLGSSIPGIDMVSSQDPFECAFAAISIAGKLGTRLQIQMHINPFSPYFQRETLLNRLRPAMARHTLPHADCIRPVSERIKTSVLDQKLTLKCEPQVLPVYVDVSRYETEEPTESVRENYPQFETTVLMAGRIHPQKDIPCALRAFKKVVSQEPKTGLVIVGEGPLEDAMKKRVVDMGLSDNVVFEGWKTDMLSYMKTCDIFLMTSTHEGYQRALGEAAAAGVPVVTTDTGPVGSVYIDRDSVLACDVGDDACIARGLLELVRDRDMRTKLVERAREVGRTSIAPSYDVYLELYKQSLEGCGTTQTQ